MTNDSPLSFALPATARKKSQQHSMAAGFPPTAASCCERRRALAQTFAALIADPRNPTHITHMVADVLRSRMLAIAYGYPDGNDLTFLRSDPGFKLACGRLPDTGANLCPQSTVLRWKNAPTLREIIRLTHALVDIWCRSYAKPPASVVLDIDDTPDVVHGRQEMAEWNTTNAASRRAQQSH